MFEFSLPPSLLISLIVAVVIPAIVSFVTTTVTNTAIKGALLAGLSIAAGVLSEAATSIADGTPYDIGVGVMNALMSWAVAQGSYSSVWKPTGAADAIQNVGVTDRH